MSAIARRVDDSWLLGASLVVASGTIVAAALALGWVAWRLIAT